jgi:tol-pal system-associated acyl-CoA thioesterase
LQEKSKAKKRRCTINTSLKIKIYYEDTDAGGVVYYANYLRFMERARTEYLAAKGIDVAEYHNKGYFFPVIHVDIHYKRPARLGDVIEVTADLIEMTNVTVSFRQEVIRADTLLVDSTVKLACINADGKPRRLPPEFTSLFTL